MAGDGFCFKIENQSVKIDNLSWQGSLRMLKCRILH